MQAVVQNVVVKINKHENNGIRDLLVCYICMLNDTMLECKSAKRI